MSAQVDVMAVIDEAVDTLRDDGNRALPGDLEIARAAVAELIEAARDYADVEANAYDITQRIPAATRLRAALARVQGVNP